MANVMIRNDLHAIADGVIGGDGDDRRTHDLRRPWSPWKSAPSGSPFAHNRARRRCPQSYLRRPPAARRPVFQPSSQWPGKRSRLERWSRRAPLFCFRMGRIDSESCISATSRATIIPLFQRCTRSERELPTQENHANADSSLGGDREAPVLIWSPKTK